MYLIVQHVFGEAQISRVFPDSLLSQGVDVSRDHAEAGVYGAGSQRSSLKALEAAHGGPDHPRAVEAAEFIKLHRTSLRIGQPIVDVPAPFPLEEIVEVVPPGSSKPSAVLVNKDTFEADVVTEHFLSSPELVTLIEHWKAWWRKDV